VVAEERTATLNDIAIEEPHVGAVDGCAPVRDRGVEVAADELMVAGNVESLAS
jgi:hypothetical protein